MGKGKELPDRILFLYKNCFNKMFLISFEYTCFFKIIWRKKDGSQKTGMILE